jgi:hypothetical protein
VRANRLPDLAPLVQLRAVDANPPKVATKLIGKVFDVQWNTTLRDRRDHAKLAKSLVRRLKNLGL